MRTLISASLIAGLVLGAEAGCKAPVASAAPAQAAAKPAATAPDSPDAIGSTRNSRVAYPMSKERAQLTYFAGPLSAAERAELASVAPNVKIVSGLKHDEALARAAEAQGMDVRLATADVLERAKNCVWVQAMSAGVDRYLHIAPLVSNDAIVFTNSRGVSGPAIADHAFAMLLALTRNMRTHLVDQATGRWDRDSAGLRPIVLQGRTMLVVGIGGIGSEIAQRAHGFGMHVIATRRTDTPAPDYVEHVGKPEELLELLPRADVVAICVPLTSETDKLFNARAFAAMKSGAYLINVARGRIVDQDALVAALDGGKLGGACLDVTDPEPLPADHPLWKHENVIITPHVASDSETTDQRSWALLKENVRRFGAGEPLLNVVDKKAGY